MMRWSIIICTHNRAADLRSNLPVLNELNYPRDRYEVLVIDNGSKDGTAEVVAAEAERNGSILYVREERLGLSYARNRGIDEARGEFVAFLDDDAWPEPDWLLELEKGFKDPSIACVGGRVIPFFTVQTGWPVWLPKPLRGFFTVVDHPQQRLLHYPGYPAGTNMAFRKRALARTGRFSTSLGRAGESLLSMEEVELCLRVERAGYRILYLPGAVVHHAVNERRLTREWVMERCQWQGISTAVLETEQFPRYRVVSRSLFYLLFLPAGSLGRLLCRWLDHERGAFFCQCQLLLCRAYLKKAWTREP